MKVLTVTQTRELDRYTIEHEPISSLDLMERAAKAIVRTIEERWDTSWKVFVFAGPGNNGGDALAVARHLDTLGYNTEEYLFVTNSILSTDCAANKERLKDKEHLHEITNQFTPPEIDEHTIVIDGLFGSGLTRPLSGGFAAVVKYINSSPATVVSIDMPSGLMCEDNAFNIRSHIIKANLTLALQLPKLSSFFAEYQEYFGEYKIIDIGLHPEGIEQTNATYFITEREEMASILKTRDKFAHKGSMGHGLLIAGCYGMAGAAILSAKAAMRSGLGKLTIVTPYLNTPILQTAVPEAILKIDPNDKRFTQAGHQTDIYQATAIGPGIGTSKDTALAVIEQICRTQNPLLLDADAINLLGDRRGWIQQLPANTILTPHIKELDRITGISSESYERLSKAKELAMRHSFYVVLKGKWTAVITPKGKVYFNPTGNPGMATAGSGDVLAGVILGLLARGYNQEEACRLGTFIHGLAGDIAAEAIGMESMLSSDIIRFLPEAFKELYKAREELDFEYKQL